MQINRNSEASPRRVPVFFAQMQPFAAAFAVKSVTELVTEFATEFATDPSALYECLTVISQSAPESDFLP
jgi:hypothetical protein